MGPDASLTPELIQAQSFTTAFRGFDPAEVRSFLSRVATEVRAWRERAEQLESAWHSAEERAARPPVLDEDTLMTAVGEETASILRSARAAAADMRAKATEESERLLGDARRESEELLSSARSQSEALLSEARTEGDKQRSDAAAESEKLLTEARSESQRMLEEARTEADHLRTAAEDAASRTAASAEDAAARLMSGARSEAAETLERVRVEAEAIRAAAEKDRQLTIEGATSTRDRILEDLSRRRRIATVQIEQLRAGRERLIESYAVVRRTLEEASAELSRADAEARAAADEVGRRYSESPDDIDLDGPAGSQPAAARPATGQPEADHREPEPVAEEAEHATEAAADEPEPATEAAAEEPEPDGAVEEDAAPEAAAQPEPAVEEAAQPEPEQPQPEPEQPQPNQEPEAEQPEAEQPEAEQPEVAAEEEVAAEQEAGAQPGAEGEAAAGPEEAVQPGQPAEPEPPVGEPAPGSAVDELFARIRATRPDGGPEPDHEATAGAGEGRTPGEGEEPQEDDEEGGEQLSDADEALLQKRESAVVDLEVTLTRRLKRALQDEQNDVLDRLRNLRGDPTAERLLPDPDAQTARYSSAARPLLAQAASAGAAFALSELDAEGSAPGGEPQIDDLAAETGQGIVDPLRRRLEQAIARNAGDDQAVLVEALGAAYREWKTQRIERLSGDVLSAAFSRGSWQAVPEGTMLRWIVEDTDGPCPDCDDDALAGVLPKGEPFPTGQHHPPAHSGCRCLLVPGPPAE